MPWGNRSMVLRDPDGGLVNLFTPHHPGGEGEVRLLTRLCVVPPTMGGPHG